MMISGDRLSISGNLPTSYCFTHIPHIWGWATWRRAWRQYDIELKDWPANWRSIRSHAALPDRIWRKFEGFFNSAKANQIDTWDYQWFYSIWKNEGLVISPAVNLISNVGFDGQATHTNDPESIFSQMKTQPMDFPLVHPPQVLRNQDFESKSYKTIFPRALQRISHAISKRLKKMKRF